MNLKKSPSHFLLLLVCLFIPASIGAFQSAPTVDWNLVHTKTLDGIDALYNFRFTAAEQKFDSVIQMAPKDPRGYFFKAMIYSYRHGFLRQQKEFDRFVELSEKVIAVSEEILKKDKKNSTAMFYLGGIYGYRGILRSAQGQMMRAVWDGRKGYSYLGDAIKADPKNHDAEMGLGLFNYMVSQIPASFRWLVKLIGFGGDRVKGLEQLERAATKGTYANNEARLWLAQFLQQEEEYEKSFQYFDQLTTSYPHNPMYVYYHGNILLFSLRKAEEALASYKKVLAIHNPEAERFTNAAQYQIGDVYRFQNNFSEAIKSYSTFINLPNADTAAQSAARYWIGICYEIMGDREKAIPYYQLSLHRWDAKERAQAPLSGEEIAVLRVTNSYNAGEYDNVIESSSMLLKNTSFSDEQRARVYLALGQSFAEKGNPQQALEEFGKILAFALPKNSSTPPNAYYQRGLVHRRAGKKDLAKVEFEKALKFKDYPGEKWMQQRVERELKRME